MVRREILVCCVFVLFFFFFLFSSLDLAGLWYFSFLVLQGWIWTGWLAAFMDYGSHGMCDVLGIVCLLAGEGGGRLGGLLCMQNY